MFCFPLLCPPLLYPYERIENGNDKEFIEHNKIKSFKIKSIFLDYVINISSIIAK